MSDVTPLDTTHAEFAFTDANRAEADRIIRKYPEGRQASAVMPLLDLAQRQNDGWLSQPAIEYVAHFLSMPAIRVQEVATFYTMYNLKPVGRHHVQVCTSLSCALRGAQAVMDTCKRVLDIGVGQTTDDDLFTLSEVECLCACVNAPMVQIDDDFYEDLSAETMETILNELRDGKTPAPGSRIGRRSSEPAGGLTTLRVSPSPAVKTKKGEGR
jgi:NADH-quinone oxidoreductase subunit E